MKRPLVAAIALIFTLVALALAWRWLAAEGLLSARLLRDQLSALSSLRDNPLLIPAVMAVYSLLLLAMFPLSVLVVLTGLLFGPLWGLFYATLGTLSSSVVSYLAGRQLGQEILLRHGGRHLRMASRYLGRRGIRTMTVINLLPLAPFTLTNMLAGASHIRFRDYMIGSTLGIVPGLAVVTLLGSQIGALITATDGTELALAIGGALVFLALWLLIRARTGRAASSTDVASGASHALRDTGPEETHRNHEYGGHRD